MFALDPAALLLALSPAFHPSIEPWDLLARLCLALLAGGTLGLDRQLSHKPAGVRTHMLVSFGAALFATIPLSLGSSDDAISRAIQGVATGVSFLGAGEILRRPDPVHSDRQEARDREARDRQDRGTGQAGKSRREGASSHPSRTHPHRQQRVKGLTSAAAIWVSAGLGFAAGCGLWSLVAIATLLAFLVLRLVALERRP